MFDSKDSKGKKDEPDTDPFSKLIGWIFGLCLTIAIGGWLLQLGTCYFLQALPVLSVIFLIAVVAFIAYQVWKNKTRW